MIEPDDVVTVGSREKTRFCVDGQVEKPDCHEYEKGLTLDGAISKAGGLKIDLASTKDVKVRRIVNEKLQVFTLSLDDVSETGSRFRIEPDDQIFVAKADCLVTVGGCVKTPGQYPLTTGMTITDAIQKAGGTHSVDCWGKLSNVQLKRGSGPPESVDVKAIQEGKRDDILLQCGDKIYLKSRAI